MSDGIEPTADEIADQLVADAEGGVEASTLDAPSDESSGTNDQGGALSHLPTGPIHHIRMAVTDVDRSKAFYTEVLGFRVAVDAPPPPDDEHHEVLVDSLQGGVILMHQGMFFGLRPVERERAGSDRFDPLRVGLDHLSFSVPARADLDAAVRLLDERGVEHGPIRELVPLGLCFLAFFDPDGIALELTAPISDGQ